MVLYAHPYVLVRALGVFGTVAAPIDEWGVGWKFSVPNGTTIPQSELAAMAEAASSEIQTFHATSSIAAGSATFLLKITCAYIGTDGKYVGGGAQETQEFTYPAPVAGSGTVVHPYSAATALTHFSEFSRGKASKGRVYWPSAALAVSGVTGAYNTTIQTQISGQYRTLIDQLNTDAAAVFTQDPIHVSVMGQDTTHLPGGSPPRTGIVVAVGMGLNPDTQRRRDNKIPENHNRLELNTVAGLQQQLRDRRLTHLA